MDKAYKEVAPVSEEERAAITRKTAYSLPDEPSARGMTPDQIRKRFWEAMVGDRHSLLAEIDRVAKEVNAALDALVLLIGSVEEDIENIKPSKIGYVELIADRWGGDTGIYSQETEIEGITENSQIDITPNSEQLAEFRQKGITLVAENDGGVVKVYAIGQKPERSHTIQIKITEVEEWGEG